MTFSGATLMSCNKMSSDVTMAVLCDKSSMTMNRMYNDKPRKFDVIKEETRC